MIYAAKWYAKRRGFVGYTEKSAKNERFLWEQKPQGKRRIVSAKIDYKFVSNSTAGAAHGANFILMKMDSMRSLGNRSSTKAQKGLEGGSPARRAGQRLTAIQETAPLNSRKAV